MYGREELKKYTSSDIEEIDDALLEASEDGIIKMTRVYIASEADSVMESYEKRIAQLERMYKQELDKATEWGNELIFANARIKELEADIQLIEKNTDYLANRCKELEATISNLENNQKEK